MDFEQTLMLGHKLLVCTKSSKLTQLPTFSPHCKTNEALL